MTCILVVAKRLQRKVAEKKTDGKGMLHMITSFSALTRMRGAAEGQQDHRETNGADEGH